MEIQGLYKTYEENLEAEKLAKEKNLKSKKKRKQIKFENAFAKSISRIFHLITDIIAYVLAIIGLFCLLNPQTKEINISSLKEVFNYILGGI